MIANLIIDPQVPPRLERRVLTSQVLKSKVPRFVVINPEYKDKADILANNPDACTIDFLSSHEMLLNKGNLQSAKRLTILVQTYKYLSRFNYHYSNNFNLKSMSILLKVLDALSSDDAHVLGELEYWNNNNFDTLLKHCQEENLIEKGKSKNEGNYFKQFVEMLSSNKAFQRNLRSMLDFLYQIHGHFIAKSNKMESFDLIKSSKLIWCTSDQVGQINYMTALAYYCMLSARSSVYLDSTVPINMLKSIINDSCNVTSLVLTSSTPANFLSPCVALADCLYVSLQEPHFDLLLQKMATNTSDLIKTTHVTSNSLTNEFVNCPYSELVGKYLAYDTVKDDIHLFSVPNDPTKIHQKKYDLSTVAKKPRTAEEEIDQPLHASKDEKINLPNSKSSSKEISSVLNDIKDKLDKLFDRLSDNSSIDYKQILAKLDEVETSLKQVKQIDLKDQQDSFVPQHHVARDIFGNPEDESKYDIEQAFQEEFEKQDPNTKSDDPLQQQFDSQFQKASDDETVSMPNTAKSEQDSSDKGLDSNSNVDTEFPSTDE